MGNKKNKRRGRKDQLLVVDVLDGSRLPPVVTPTAEEVAVPAAASRSQDEREGVGVVSSDEEDGYEEPVELLELRNYWYSKNAAKLF